MKYRNKEKVLVHSLGDSKEYKAVVVGVQSECLGERFYIIKMIESFYKTPYGYDCAVITEHCLKKDLSKYKDDSEYDHAYENNIKNKMYCEFLGRVK